MSLYGDLLTGMTYTLFLPMYLHHYRTNPVPQAWLIIGLVAVTSLLQWAAWARSRRTLSVLAFVTQVGVFTTNTIFQWPFGTDATLLPQFIFAITIHVGSNLLFSAKEKLGMIWYAFGWAVVATLLTDSLDTPSTLLVCTSATLLTSALHLDAARRLFTDEAAAARAAALILAAAFALHLGNEILRIATVPGYGATGGFNITKMGFLAAMGIIATGAFRDQVSIKQSLQNLVQLRGSEMARQAEVMQMISLALEASETAIAITDAQHRVIWSNHALRALLGLGGSGGGAGHTAPATAEDLAKLSLVDALGLSDEAIQTFDGCFTASLQSMELRLGEQELRLTVSPFTVYKPDAPSAHGDNSGAGVGDIRYLLSLNDITQVRARERAERAAEQAARTAMQESMETLTHELRTPLQGIIGMTSLVFDNSSQVSPEEMYQCMTTVMASSRLLLTLINNLLDSHKMDANMMNVFLLEPVPLTPALKEAAHFCRPIAALNDTKSQLIIDFDETDNVVVQSNPVRFQQVLVNLVSNAIKYGGHGTIKVRAEVLPLEQANQRIQKALVAGIDPASVQCPTPMVAVVSVEDSGDGIPLEMVGRVFQKFSQYSDPAKAYTRSTCFNAHTSGTGIGLNLCCKLVQRMNGNIWVTNKPTGGACFSFSLPVLSMAGNQDRLPTDSMEPPLASEAIVDTAVAEVRQQPAGARSYEAMKVLVVDDTLINLKVLERMIKQISSAFYVVAVESGAKALEVLAREHFDLVITDIQMPQMDGIELSKIILKSGLITPKPIVVALTAETTESLHQRCSAAGISHILYKPISSHQFKIFFESTLKTISH